MDYVSTSNVCVAVPRWTTETINILDLLVDRIVEIHVTVPGEFDLYAPVDEQGKGNLWRVETFTDISNDDVDLFNADKQAFWELHLDKVTAQMISNISTIRCVDWKIK